MFRSDVADGKQLSMVMMLRQALRLAVTPQPFIETDLVRVQQGAGFQMCA